MSAENNVIDKIKAAENEAVSIRQVAIETGRTVTIEAERKAAAFLENMTAEAEITAKRIIKEASGHAAEHLASAAKKAEDKAKKMSADIEPRLNTAAALIIERILK